MSLPIIFVVSGAHDTGKSSVLNCLNQDFGYPVRKEAFLLLREKLGEGRFFHDTKKPLVFDSSPTHICPLCRPLEFTKMLLEEQLLIEQSCQEPITIIERGAYDYIAHLRFRGINTSLSDLSFRPQLFAPYKTVFVLEVMRELQEPKWGKNIDTRLQEALKINKLIAGEYLRQGFKVVLVPKATIKERVFFIKKAIRTAA